MVIENIPQFICLITAVGCAAYLGGLFQDWVNS